MAEFIWIKKALFLTTSFLALLCGYGTQADVNQVTGWSCSGPKNATLDAESQANLDTLLKSLADKAPKNNGFSQTHAGKADRRLYGLAQCRGDVSAADCRHCLRNATWTSSAQCGARREGIVWLRWCLLRYSDAIFFGTWDRAGIAKVNQTTPLEDPNVVPRGVDLMNGLAGTAPRHVSMFDTNAVDVGPLERRFGMAQCTRDVDPAGCRECLVAQLETFRARIGNRRGWEIYGSSCSLWYHDYRFYFDSVTTNQGGRRYSANWFRTVVIVMAFLLHCYINN
ncbi:unnamed protein product [Linum trigynum]|uniref:Gnk2-homologous domain-containing protein n=1 Tax=Linum trigynum TaxID=586398 RepID=A0AAV2FI92_9ROSI